MADRRPESEPWTEINRRTARAIADWPDPNTDARSAVEEAIDNPTLSVRRNRRTVTP